MPEDLTIWVTDQYSQFCGLGDWANTAHTPAGWLEAAFTFHWVTGAFLDEELVPGALNIRPMIEFIDQEQDTTDDSGAMVIIRIDYDDPIRWWL